MAIATRTTTTRTVHASGAVTTTTTTEEAPASIPARYAPYTGRAPRNTLAVGKLVPLRAYPGWAVRCTGTSYYAVGPYGRMSHAYRTFKGAAGYARRGGVA